MCDQSHKSKRGLDNNTLKANIDWKRVDEIELQGGEVLAMKNAKELYLWLTREMGKKVNLITNGVLISDEWAEYLVKGANWIQISVNAATKRTHELVNQNSNFERVIENIRKMIRLKGQYEMDVEIIYKFTILSENTDEIGNAVEFADALGCDTIAFGYDVSIPALLEDDRDRREKLKNTIAKLTQDPLRITIGLKRLEQLGLVEAENYTSLW
jgi:sulfatase maturation enzyme AslB (radical SAM superfamily)